MNENTRNFSQGTFKLTFEDKGAMIFLNVRNCWPSNTASFGDVMSCSLLKLVSMKLFLPSSAKKKEQLAGFSKLFVPVNQTTLFWIQEGYNVNMHHYVSLRAPKIINSLTFWMHHDLRRQVLVVLTMLIVSCRLFTLCKD